MIFQIRKMLRKDLEGVFKLETLWEKEELAYLFESITEKEFLTTMIQFNDYHLVAVVNDEIIGYINGTISRQNDGIVSGNISPNETERATANTLCSEKGEKNATSKSLIHNLAGSH